jgi:hypothetical protein
MPVPAHEIESQFDDFNRKRDVNIWTTEYHYQTRGGAAAGPLIRRREALAGYTGDLKLPRPPPVKLRGVDMVSNEELMSKLRKNYGNPHVNPPYGVSDLKIAHPARRANSTVDIVEGGPTYFVEAPSRGGPTPAQDLSQRISAELGPGARPGLQESRSAGTLSHAAAKMFERPRARALDGMRPGEYEDLKARFGLGASGRAVREPLGAGIGDMMGRKEELNKMCGKISPQEYANVSNVWAL